MSSHTISLTSPQNTGARQARRRKGLSDPVLFMWITAAVAVGLVMGVVAYLRLALADMETRDIDRLQDRARITALELDVLSGQAAVLSSELTAAAMTYVADTSTAEDKRTARQNVAKALSDSLFTGVAILDAKARPIAQVSAYPAQAGEQRAIHSALMQYTELLNERTKFIAAGELVLVSSGRFAFSMNKTVLDNILAGQSQPGVSAMLTRPDGAVILAMTGGETPARIDSPQNWMTPAVPGEARSARLTVGGQDRPVVSLALEDSDAVLYVLGPRASLTRLAQEQGWLALALFGPGVLALLLAISLIQNEWARGDRRINASADVVARADIACELLQAGIIDWNTIDATVSYSRGWSDLIDPVGHLDGQSEEIFDWIERVHDEDRPTVRAGYQALLDGEEDAVRQSFRVRRSDGVFIHVMESAVARRKADGRTSRIVLVQTQL